MTLSRETLDAALVAINEQRARRRRDIAAVVAGRRTDLPGRLERELERLNTIHAELAAERAGLDGPTVATAQAEVDDAITRHAALMAAADKAFG